MAKLFGLFGKDKKAASAIRDRISTAGIFDDAPAPAGPAKVHSLSEQTFLRSGGSRLLRELPPQADWTVQGGELRASGSKWEFVEDGAESLHALSSRIAGIAPGTTLRLAAVVKPKGRKTIALSVQGEGPAQRPLCEAIFKLHKELVTTTRSSSEAATIKSASITPLGEGVYAVEMVVSLDDAATTGATVSIRSRKSPNGATPYEGENLGCFEVSGITVRA